MLFFFCFFYFLCFILQCCNFCGYRIVIHVIFFRLFILTLGDDEVNVYIRCFDWIMQISWGLSLRTFSWIWKLVSILLVPVRLFSIILFFVIFFIDIMFNICVRVIYIMCNLKSMWTCSRFLFLLCLTFFSFS